MFQYSGKVVSIAAFDSRVFFTKDHDNEIHILINNEHFAKSIDENAKIKRYRSNLYSDGLLDFSANSEERLIEGNLTFEVEYLYAYNPIQQSKLQVIHFVCGLSNVFVSDMREISIQFLYVMQDKNPCRKGTPPCAGLCLLRPIKINSTDGGYNCSSNGIRAKNDSNSYNEPTLHTFLTTDSTFGLHNITKKNYGNSLENPTNSSATSIPTSSSTTDPNITQPSNTTSTPTNGTTPDKTTSSQSSPTSADNLDPKESHTDLKVVVVILLLAFVVCGVYIYRRRAGYSRFPFQNIRWRRNNDHINFSHQEL